MNIKIFTEDVEDKSSIFFDIVANNCFSVNGKWSFSITFGSFETFISNSFGDMDVFILYSSYKFINYEKNLCLYIIPKIIEYCKRYIPLSFKVNSITIIVPKRACDNVTEATKCLKEISNLIKNNH